jgi:hypothetical protein
VSNTEYDKYLRGYTVNDPPQLSLEATGIPALVRYIYALPSKGRFQTLEYHVTANMDTMLKSLELYCGGSSTQQKEEITTCCVEARRAASRKIASLHSTLSDGRLEKLKTEMAKAEDAWVTHAVTKFDTWASTIKSQTVGYIFKKHGAHSTKKAGSHNWNDALLNPVRNTVDKLFVPLRGELATDLSMEIGQELGKVLQKLIQTLSGKFSAVIQ